MKSNHTNRKIYLLIFALVFILYGNSIKNEYSLDDNYVTVTTKDKPNNARIEKGIKGIPKLFTTHYVETAAQSFEYRPLVLVTFAIEYQFFGSNPHVSHFISVLLYAITCMLLFSILCRLLKSYNFIFPLLIVFLFIIHPIHTEVVDNIKCRDELLSFLFGMCSLHFFLKNPSSVSPKGRNSLPFGKGWGWVLVGILFLFMSLLCKRTAILFIGLIPLTIYFFTDVKLKRILLLSVFPLLAILVYTILKKTLVHGAPVVRDFAFFENPLYYEHGFLARIPIAFYSLGYYFRLLIFPYPLCCYYGYDTIPTTGWVSPFYIASVLFYFAIGIYALIKLPKKNILSYGILIYLIGVFPFANLMQPVVGIVGERFIYFASFGFCIGVAYLLLSAFKINLTPNPFPSERVGDRWMGFKLFVGFILILYSTLVISRNTKWKNELTLFRNDVEQFPNSCNLHYLIGTHLYPQIFNTPNGVKRDAMIKETTFHYKQAVQIMKDGVAMYPTDYHTISNIGTIYNNIFNDVVTAQPYFKKSLAINPKDEVTQYNLILCYEKMHLPDTAIVLYEKMIRANTTYPAVYFNLHELYLTKQAYAKAISCDEKATLQCPAEFKARAYINLGNTYMLIKDTLMGVKSFKKAIELEPTNVKLRQQVEDFIKKTRYNSK
ncbi:MAG: hypothetical protein ACYDCN_07220 [Bacteroidia bacterium]